jgi:hypothetical protein
MPDLKYAVDAKGRLKYIYDAGGVVLYSLFCQSSFSDNMPLNKRRIDLIQNSEGD